MFKSFFLAGFECATGYNMHGEWIDQIAATEHDRHVDEDYRRLREAGIRAVREGIRWPYVDFRGHYDFSSVTPFVKAACYHGIEVIWDLYHYGYPEDLDIFSEEFQRRFAAYCHAAARYIKSHQEGPYYFTPVNEPSFLSWAGGDMRRFMPHCEGRSADMKVVLARAGINGINAIRDVIPEARIVNVDPICRVVPPSDDPEVVAETEQYNEHSIFESWDMLCGRIMPELGGSRAHLDIIGMNYYWTNQWVMGQAEHPLEPEDTRLVELRELVRKVWLRYGGDLLISETAHVQEMRGEWMNYVAKESEALLEEGVPLQGVCLYPILGMPEWHMRDQWTRMGLWDLEPSDGRLQRKVYQPMLEALKKAEKKITRLRKRELTCA